MSDRVVGIAVLDRAAGRLAIWCQRADGRRLYQDIPVHAAGTPKTCTPSWEYAVAGDTLAMQPSVHVRVDRLEGKGWETEFHNEGSWSVRFIERPAADQSEGVTLYERAAIANKGGFA